MDEIAESPASRIACRLAHGRDAEQLAELSAILQRQHAARHPEIFKPFDQASGIGLFRDQVARPDVVIFIGEVLHTPVGYLMAEVVTRDETPFKRAMTALHIQHLVVDKDFRSHGVGQALLAQAELEARRRECDVLELACWSFNEAALAFFTVDGFEPYQVRMTRPAR